MDWITDTPPSEFKDADYVISTTEKKNMTVHLTVTFLFKLWARSFPDLADAAIHKYIKDKYCIEKWDVATIIKRNTV